MGHERIGFLPKTKQWQSIVHELVKYSGDSEVISKIAENTLYCIRSSYNSIAYDESMISAIRFLTTLCFSASSDSQGEYLNQQGFCTDSELSLFSLMKSVEQYLATSTASLEINKMAKDALMQALVTYKQSHETVQLKLAGFESDSVWSKTATGAAFCELTRSFVASFTDRQLRYYLERVAAGTLSNYSQLVSFTKELTAQTNAITSHTSEVSKIMQSFAAGWYNKYSARTTPPDSDISRFLSMAFGKIKEEFRREAAGL
ncbi:MAG: hypothetical protein Q7J85_01770 [Bacillota bacterium]|nr:hypothetical protein [Bacillota bacterium]